MRNVVCGFLFMAAVLQGQRLPGNAADEALKNRLRNFNLLKSPPPVFHKAVPLQSGVSPKVCSTPLLKANPMGTADQMRTVNPSVPPEQTAGDELKRVPAPPCDEIVAESK